MPYFSKSVANFYRSIFTTEIVNGLRLVEVRTPSKLWESLAKESSLRGS
ncbi:hypothetical protein [Limnospira platensis]